MTSSIQTPPYLTDEVVRVSEAEDRQLVEKVVRRRDESAFRRLYRRHSPALYLFSLRLSGGDESRAEEMVQCTWIRALERLPAFEWRSTFRTWLCGIAVNCGRELLREKKTPADVNHETMPDPAGAHGDRAAERIDLERAIARLPQGYRQVFVLHDIEGFTHEEIGELLGLEPGTSKSQLHHARRRLREALMPASRTGGVT